ncbi:MAG: hypothetical protein II178_01300, partial [Selenomonadaceae bacterium]|nr:hypothetical protein [Selenomonadaceae bacterium]
MLAPGNVRGISFLVDDDLFAVDLDGILASLSSYLTPEPNISLIYPLSVNSVMNFCLIGFHFPT